MGVVTHPPRKTRFRLLVQLYRTGLVTRRVPSERFQASNYPPFPSFLARGQTDLEFFPRGPRGQTDLEFFPRGPRGQTDLRCSGSERFRICSKRLRGVKRL